MFTVLFDADCDFDNPTISAPDIPNAETALNFIGSLKEFFGMSADECNEQFLVIRLSDGKSCHPRVKRETA